MASRITVLGTITELIPSDNEKKTVASFQIDSPNAPTIVVTGYGKVAPKMQEIVGSSCVLTGQVSPIIDDKGRWSMGSFGVSADEIFASTPWGETQVLVNVLGKYSDRFAEYAQAGSWSKYNFNISHSFMPKKDDGKYPYANWKITKLGASNDELQNRFVRYLKDGDLLEATVSLSWYEKKDGGIGMSASLKSHSFVGGNRND